MMGTTLIPFAPATSAASTIAVTSTSQRVALPLLSTPGSIYLSNVGTKECFVELGGATVTAVAGGAVTAASDGSLALPSGFFGVIGYNPATQGFLAAVCAGTDTTTLRIKAGTSE
jgi:hypothetical protein